MDVDKLIIETIPPEGYIYGFSNLSGLLNRKYADYSYAISIGKKLNDAIINELEGSGPTKKYYDHYREINKELEELLNNISAKLKAINIDSVIIRPTFEDSELDDAYFKTLITDFSHKMAATRAGLGWIGKTDLFVSEKYGPRLRLATVLTNAELPASMSPCDESRCGSCDICVAKCPAKAANGISWNIGTERNSFFDAFKCRDKCRELAKNNLDVNVSICGICVSVCPIGKRVHSNERPKGISAEQGPRGR
jgi:epoxyqueuosine reductase